MGTALRISNWIALALFGISVLGIGVAQPSAAVLSALNLLPFGSALLAARPDTRRAALWFAAGVNLLWAVLFVACAVIVAMGLGGMFIAIPLTLAIALPCGLNTHFFWRALRVKG